MSTTTNIQPAQVEITRGISKYSGKPEITVTPVWDGVDRPRIGGWGFTGKDGVLAQRLAAAIMAGVVYSGGTIAVDNQGQTYVKATSAVMGKYANADLKRLGF